MSDFTTEQRRSMTSSNPALATEQQAEYMNIQLDDTYALKINEDKSNNNIFRIINSEVTGLAFEYRYIEGKYHPALDEQEYFYKESEGEDENNMEIVTKSYWDNKSLQSGAGLEEDNEWHLNTREGTTVKYPIRPEKYASWVNDSHEYVTDFETTESNMIAMIRTLDTWNTSGGGTGNMETSVFGEYFEKILGKSDDKQPYMTVGYTAYQSDPNDGYMTPGYDKTGELILINTGDVENFSFGKVVASKDLPSRILFVPYGRVGSIPDDADITSTFSSGSQIISLIAEQVVLNLMWYYETSRQYLNLNPHKNDINNQPVLDSLDSTINFLELWEIDDNRATFTVMLQLMTDIEAVRTPAILTNRKAYVNAYLGTSPDLYLERFDVIDLRLTKDMGTLKEIMSALGGGDTIDNIFDDREQAALFYTKFFVVKQAIQDGDYYMRIFTDDADNISIGDECYVLTDDEDVPELFATVTDIVDGRIVDQLNTIYDSDGNVTYAYTECKKIFFGKTLFSTKYLTTDQFRIIKEIDRTL